MLSGLISGGFGASRSKVMLRRTHFGTNLHGQNCGRQVPHVHQIVELAAEGITANAVAPGPTETDLCRANSPKGGEGEARCLARVPMGRLALTHEVAAAIAFLAADTASFHRSDPIRRWWRKPRDSLGRG